MTDLPASFLRLRSEGGGGSAETCRAHAEAIGACFCAMVEEDVEGGSRIATIVRTLNPCEDGTLVRRFIVGHCDDALMGGGQVVRESIT